MDGLYINGQRPASKKAVKAAVLADPASVYIEATSVFATVGGLTLAKMLVGQRVTFVGPCPYTSRKFYGTITRVAADKWKVE